MDGIDKGIKQALFVAFVLFIFDGRMDINQQIAESGLEVDSLIALSED